MIRLLKSRKGQNTAEYAIVIGLVVAAAIAMQTYVKRGINAKIKDGTDLVTSVGGDVGGGAGTLGTTGQYEPYYASSSFDVTRGNTEQEDVAEGGSVTRTKSRDSIKRTGTVTTGEAEDE